MLSLPHVPRYLCVPGIAFKNLLEVIWGLKYYLPERIFIHLHSLLEAPAFLDHLSPILLGHVHDVTWGSNLFQDGLILPQSGSLLWFSNLIRGHLSRDLAFREPWTLSFVSEVLKLCQRLIISSGLGNAPGPTQFQIPGPALSILSSLMLVQLLLTILLTIWCVESCFSSSLFLNYNQQEGWLKLLSLTLSQTEGFFWLLLPRQFLEHTKWLCWYTYITTLFFPLGMKTR